MDPTEKEHRKERRTIRPAKKMHRCRFLTVGNMQTLPPLFRDLFRRRGTDGKHKTHPSCMLWSEQKKTEEEEGSIEITEEGFAPSVSCPAEPSASSSAALLSTFIRAAWQKKRKGTE